MVERIVLMTSMTDRDPMTAIICGTMTATMTLVQVKLWW